MAHEPINRRRLLKGAGALGVSGLATSMAGCSGQDPSNQAPDASGGDGDGGTPSPTEDPTTEPPDDGSDATVKAASNPAYGDVLVDTDGNSLYMFDPDEQGASTCYDDCASAWPPLTVESEDALSAGSDVTADLGTTERDDGSLQVTADGWPLYYFARDEETGDVNGQGVFNVWWVLRPDGSVARSTVSAAEHETLGNVLTDADGNVLYMFAPDEMGASTCYDGCAEAWPPLTVESAEDLLPAATTSADLGTTERDDGSLQVTAGGWPLYYFANDEEAGQARGQEVLNVWFVLRPDGSPLEPTVSVRDLDDLGQVITDADGMTLYMFDPDEQGASTCYDGCAEAWPPLTVESADALVDSVVAD
ncbi:MAG TPA: hypothetical protein VKA37_10500, partial [Halobacteriales archaeon]|nr:hypothetical protein [Halobacteriales archaeon]